MKSFHFQEMDWVISFPNGGNKGRKYLYYSVSFLDRKKSGYEQVCLYQIVDKPEFEAKFPYTVGYFRGKADERNDFKSTYLEIRVLNCIEEFWKFLNDLDI